jgi:TldD protein
LSRSIQNRVVSVCSALGLLALLGPVTARVAQAAPPDASAKRSPLLAAMQAELDRSFKTLSAQDPPAYYLGYTITDTKRAEVSGSNGALLSSSENHNRWLEVSVRTGSYDLDNTHKVGTRQEQRGGPGEPVPIDDDTEVLRRAIWLETDKQYRSAAEALIKIKTGKEVKVETAEGAAPDFTHEQSHTYIGPETSFKLERKPWEEKVRAYTKEFRDSPAVINSIVTFTAQAQNAYQTSSEGTQLQYGQIRYRL